MKDTYIQTKNTLLKTLYTTGIKPLLFLQDPETIHDATIACGTYLGRFACARFGIQKVFDFEDPILSQTYKGIVFRNPIGLSAGFDKNAELTAIIPSIGFGFEEIGSVTAQPCEGNQRLRLWRLIKEESIRVHYGLKNDGADAICARIKDEKISVPIGISIAKTNCKETCDSDAGIQDYLYSFKRFQYTGDYITLNISCPNAYGGMPFNTPDLLEGLLKRVRSIPVSKLVFLKISPDLSKETLNTIIDIARTYTIDGFVVSNLTKRAGEVGGLSGSYVRTISTELISYIYKHTQGRSLIIGSGGIMNAHDAYEKIQHGASLLQMITGLIYRGPQVVGEINHGLSALLCRDGYMNIREAVGVRA